MICKRRGCGVDFDPSAVKDAGECSYHPGAPVFHEGLKSWSCCKDKNKPVMEFDQFLALPRCAKAPLHTTEPQTPPPKQVPGGKVADATEALDQVQLEEPPPAPKVPTHAAPITPSTPGANERKEPAPEVGDPESLTSVAAGTRCQRSGCNFVAESAISERNRAEEDCRYHRGTPVFHEGSKGYTCCKRRVLDFDDFLQIAPCTTSTHGHLFAPPPPTDGAAVTCRIDHYETPTDVRITVYAKAVDAAVSTVAIGKQEVLLDLSLAPAGSIAHTRRFQRTLRPFGEVDVEQSSYSIGKMKLDLVLVKATPGQSWPALERDDPVYGYGVTFGHNK